MKITPSEILRDAADMNGGVATGNMTYRQPDRTEEIRALLENRILVIDGAMGTMIQSYKLEEADYRGERFADHAFPQKGNNDLLTLTRPDVIEEIHRGFLESGVDVLETNTFNSSAIAMADYGMEDCVYELNFTAARLARKVADAVSAETPDRPRFVAGVIGPTNRTSSISPDVNDPGYRNTNFGELVDVYTESITGLVDGGSDLLLIETVFDTLNAKAAIFAILQFFDTAGVKLPIFISGAITDASGRTLTGQTTEAFWNSIAHAEPLVVGLNCSLGAKELRPYLQELSRIAGTFVSCHPNAGLPNAFGEYDQTPEEMQEILGEFAENGFVNLVGGCCGTTPAHTRMLVENVAVHPPRVERSRAAEYGAGFAFRECRRAHQCHRFRPFREIDQGRRFRHRARCRPPAGRQRCPDHRHKYGRGAYRFRGRHGALSEPACRRAGYLPGAGDDRFVQMDGHRGRPALRAGQGCRQFDQHERGCGGVSRPGQAGPLVRRCRRRHGVRRTRAGGFRRPQGGDLYQILRPAGQPGRIPARGYHFRPQYFRRRHRHRGTQ